MIQRPKRLLLLIAFLFSGLGLWAGEHAEWSEDYDGAMASAASSDTPVLLLFTGSDWCPPCKGLDKKVFGSEAFAEFAADHLVLIKADFPRYSSQDAGIKAQNDRLAERYGIEGFPTVILLSSEGVELQRKVGNHWKTPAAFIAMVERTVGES